MSGAMKGQVGSFDSTEKKNCTFSPLKNYTFTSIEKKYTNLIPLKKNYTIIPKIYNFDLTELISGLILTLLNQSSGSAPVVVEEKEATV